MSDDIIIIDLEKYRGNGSTSFTGRIQGKDVRKELSLDNKEDSSEIFHIQIPLNTTSFNPSFFLGLFYDSIRKLKSIEKFREKFIFIFSDKEDLEIKKIIESNIDEALFYAESSLKDSKKGYRLI